MPVIIELETDEIAFLQSVRAVKSHGWGSIEGIIAAHRIETVKEHLTRKI